MGNSTINPALYAWPTAVEMAADLGMSEPRGSRLINVWRYRNRIPPGRYAQIAAAARRRGFDHITLEALHENGSLS